MSIQRRQLVKALGALAAGGSLVGREGIAREAATTLSKVPRPERPNILLLCIDDLRDWVGYLGEHPGVHTPHIDRLREEALSFDRAYCSVPVCRPSRGSMLWGLSAPTAGFTGDSRGDTRAYSALLESQDLQPLPVWFSRAGYTTIGTGKVFHRPAKAYWDDYLGYRLKSQREMLGDHGTFFDFGALPADVVHPDQVSAEFATRNLQAAHDKPWFMAVGLMLPHVPWRVPQWAFDLHPLDDVALPRVREDDLDDIPELGRQAVGGKFEIKGTPMTQHELILYRGLWREHVQAYLASCSHTDVMVGQILDALAKSEYADNTAVVLWSDHGYHLGEKLRWRKMALWEQATRVPLLIKAPWRVQGGDSFAEPVSLLDLGPTLMDLADLPVPGQFEGRSLLGIDVQAARARPALMYWNSGYSVRVGKWRWTRYRDGTEELYDLNTDPEEFDNLVGPAGWHKGGMEALLRDAEPARIPLRSQQG